MTRQPAPAPPSDGASSMQQASQSRTPNHSINLNQRNRPQLKPTHADSLDPRGEPNKSAAGGHKLAPRHLLPLDNPNLAAGVYFPAPSSTIDIHSHTTTMPSAQVNTFPATATATTPETATTPVTALTATTSPATTAATASMTTASPSAPLATTIATATSTITTTSPTTAQAATSKPKSNGGLKNRIIQRPPPLILDKVSNFYDVDAGEPRAQQAATLVSNPAAATDNQLLPAQQATIDAPTNNHHPYQQSNETGQRKATALTNGAVGNSYSPQQSISNANLKFWASLNHQNATAKTKQCSQKAKDAAQQDAKKDSTMIAADADLLGADLIITHRSSTSACPGHGPSAMATGRGGNSAAKHRQQMKDHPSRGRARDETQHGENFTNDSSGRSQQELSNNSEFDDSSTHGGTASENGGGNIIGVDNPTPPASITRSPGATRRGSEEPPASATSSRPRSTNPFLEMDEDNSSSNMELQTINSSSCTLPEPDRCFTKRPASFMAATVRPVSSLNNLHTEALPRPSNSHQKEEQHQQLHPQKQKQQQPQKQPHPQQQQLIHEQLQRLQLNEGAAPGIPDYDTSGADNSKRDDEPLFAKLPEKDSVGETIYGTRAAMIAQQQHPLPERQDGQLFFNRRESAHTEYLQPTQISLDSESAFNQPPPSATLQLPYWTDAIYELNNAIVESNSVAGGADNGQFIYLVPNGDIILELDHIKVSGLTLAEFLELVESKQFHLLKGVHVANSRGLTADLKQFLNSCFPKDSLDKQLQDLIRENIYRRTIPCTTRPPRQGEIDGVDYHFFTKEQFMEMSDRGMLLECGTYGGHFYGTLKPCKQFLIPNEQSVRNQAIQPNNQKLGQRPDANEAALAAPSEVGQVAPNIASTDSPVDVMYENHDYLRLSKFTPSTANNSESNQFYAPSGNQTSISNALKPDNTQQSIAASQSLPLPLGWECVTDPTHGTYYIDHNTQRTQYERPYEVELTKGSMGFGFTLVEADNGALLVRSIIPGGPADSNGIIKPGDVLLSAVGVSVTGLQHTDIARLFSTFAVGDRVRLTFARGAYLVDFNLVPDEYLFSNGTNGDLAIAYNPNSFSNGIYNQASFLQPNQEMLDPDYDFIIVNLKRGEQGFGFTIVSDTVQGQKVGKIQNHEICSNLKQGDILVSLNNEDITGFKHTQLVDRLKACAEGEDITLLVKRKKRFRSKTPIAMHSSSSQDGLDPSTQRAPLRNCKTPNLDGLMLRRAATARTQPSPNNGADDITMAQTIGLPTAQLVSHNLNYAPLPDQPSSYSLQSQPLQNLQNSELYYDGNHSTRSISAATQQFNSLQHFPRPQANTSASTDANFSLENPTNSLLHLDSSLAASIKPPTASMNALNPMSHQFNNFMNNDKLVMMQMQQQHIPTHQTTITSMPGHSFASADYQQVPIYTNGDVLKDESDGLGVRPPLPPAYVPYIVNPITDYDGQQNLYANREELALQRVAAQQVYSDISLLPSGALVDGGCDTQYVPVSGQGAFMYNQRQQFQPTDYLTHHQTLYGEQQPMDENLTSEQEHEYHQVDLDRGSADSNWGIRLIGGSEVDRAISIGSIVFGGVASKNGQLKSGDEIISINGINVVGATHQQVVELISACSNRASLVIRRRRFAEACEVVLTRNADEGFGFVIISSGNCALIGRIIEGSPADRCKQLHVRDRIIAVNGRYITPGMQHPEIVNMIKECGNTLRLRIIPADCYTVELIKNALSDNFGFSMRGGSEYDGSPLYILRVAPNGLARDLLNVGDQIIEINNIPAAGMTHQQAATIIKYSEPIVKLKLRRNFVTPPILLVDSPRALQKFNQVTAEMKTVNQANGTAAIAQTMLPNATNGFGGSPSVVSTTMTVSTTSTSADGGSTGNSLPADAGAAAAAAATTAQVSAVASQAADDSASSAFMTTTAPTTMMTTTTTNTIYAPPSAAHINQTQVCATSQVVTANQPPSTISNHDQPQLQQSRSQQPQQSSSAGVTLFAA